ncbi:MAG TPA: hypothetical protein PK413_11220 [Thermoanaerobaculia bacterium]|nr:hypothetical protein [Thermoanaerobaculia bacterium]
MARAAPKSASSDPPGFAALLLANRGLVDRLARSAARRARFSRDETEDFLAELYLKLVDRDYEVLRRHNGLSSLATYLTVVIANFRHDYQDRLWGRFRPSAEAMRLGANAVLLEQLLVRDGHPLPEALVLARSRPGVDLSEKELAELAARLPRRQTRKQEGEEALLALPSEDQDPESRLASGERVGLLRQALSLVAAELGRLPPKDRLLIRTSLDGLKIATLARSLGTEAKELYERRARLLQALRRRLAEAGFDGKEVTEALGVDAEPAFGRRKAS